jgi:PPK2 family polyphosphate:nucleotide phosphotransferase
MDINKYRFHPDSKLSTFSTRYNGDLDKDELKDLRDEEYDRLRDLQEQLYAEREQSLLVVLQAMDAAGKDSTIEKLTGRLNAQGCKVHSFKKPTEIELAHDFLWRIHQRVPSKGEIGIFNRSHYEDVLIVKVHHWASAETIERRYDYINGFESLLADRGTRVVKFMLNISPEYQLSRFRNRLQNPEKYWKFNPADLDERGHWDDYMNAFEVAMQRTSPDTAPWFVVPAENRRYRDYIIAKALADILEDMNPEYPEPDFDIKDYPPESIR